MVYQTMVQTKIIHVKTQNYQVFQPSLLAQAINQNNEAEGSKIIVFFFFLMI